MKPEKEKLSQKGIACDLDRKRPEKRQMRLLLVLKEGAGPLAHVGHPTLVS